MKRNSCLKIFRHFLTAPFFTHKIWPILKWTDDDTAGDIEDEWTIPLGAFLVSLSWWEGFVSEESPVNVVRWMHRLKSNMIHKTRYFTYLWVSVLKMAVFFFVSWYIVANNGILSDRENLFTHLFKESFNVHQFNVSEVKDDILGDPYDTPGSGGSVFERQYMASLDTDDNVPLNVLLIQGFCTYAAYIFAKWACKVQIQGFSFSVPLSSTVPACLTLLLAGCGARAADVCAFNPAVPDYLFFECPAVGDYMEYLKQEVSWLWALWFLSQMWITMHIWFPKSTRLAATEQLFCTPMYSGLAIDQSLVMNRRRDGEYELRYEDLMEEVQDVKMERYYAKYVDEYESSAKPGSGYNASKSSKMVRASDKITKIYGCATMWHENKEEMIEMLKSIFRIDMDYSARRLAQKYLQVFDPDYYEWETHIFFDDAFELGDNDEEEQIVNSFVKLLVRVMDEAGSHVHCKNIKVRNPALLLLIRPLNFFPTAIVLSVSIAAVVVVLAVAIAAGVFSVGIAAAAVALSVAAVAAAVALSVTAIASVVVVVVVVALGVAVLAAVVVAVAVAAVAVAAALALAAAAFALAAAVAVLTVAAVAAAAALAIAAISAAAVVLVVEI